MRPSRPRVAGRPGLAASFLLLAGAQPLAAAEPLDLSTNEGITALLAAVEAYADAANVGWIVSTPTLADAERIEAAVAERLPAAMGRIEFRTGADEGEALAWISPAIGTVGNDRGCTWQVWVSDPRLPTAEGETATLLLAPGDRVPAGPEATFRVGYTGLLQSTIYALGESGRGHIRDLARISDINIPVLEDSEELIVLVRSRQPIAFLDEIRLSLDETGGEPLDLGETYALADMTTGQTRGIGSNIQIITPDMVVRGAEGPPLAAAPTPADAGDALAEMCLFTIVSDEAA